MTWLSAYLTLGLCVGLVELNTIDETQNTCLTMAVPAEDLERFGGISEVLIKFLTINMDEGHEALRKVGKELLPNQSKKIPEDYDSDSPVHTSLLQYIIILHQEVKKELGALATEMQSLKKELQENASIGELKEEIAKLKEAVISRTDKTEIKKELKKIKESISNQMSSNEIKNELKNLGSSIQNKFVIKEIKTEAQLTRKLMPQKDVLSALRTEILNIKDKMVEKAECYEMKSMIQTIKEAVPSRSDVTEIKEMINKAIPDRDEIPLNKKEIQKMWTIISEKKPGDEHEDNVLKVWEEAFISDTSSYSDCCEILRSGHKNSGVYQILPGRARASPISTYCDMETNGGGWTVFLTRMEQKNQVNFRGDWNAYKHGFGSPSGEYWIGNENLHLMTANGDYKLRMDVKYAENDIWGEWEKFKVDSEASQYNLTVQGFNLTSTAHDTMVYHDGSSFSTFDRDNDEGDRHCALASGGGGWWYRDCYTFNPTGIRGRKDLQGMSFYSWFEGTLFVTDANFIRLMLRPRDKCATL